MTTAQRRRPKRATDVYTFKQHVRAHAERIGVRPKEIHVRTMTTKWASCSTSGRVTFSTHLLREGADWQQYVIVHELLHLRVPNHGKLFKALLSALVPGWQEIVPRTAGRTQPRLGLSRPR
jgi:predicted metal-dependent hydrolase